MQGLESCIRKNVQSKKGAVMNKHDRAKMESRLRRTLDDDWDISEGTRSAFIDICSREVDRAVRAERRAWRDTENLRLSALRRADERIIERSRNMGRKRP
jgi:hypothetical protein